MYKNSDYSKFDYNFDYKFDFKFNNCPNPIKFYSESANINNLYI